MKSRLLLIFLLMSRHRTFGLDVRMLAYVVCVSLSKSRQRCSGCAASEQFLEVPDTFDILLSSCSAVLAFYSDDLDVESDFRAFIVLLF
jgi:hypothetical protein